MNKIANIALTALIATTAIVGTARGAQASYDGCYAATISKNMNNDIRGGATAQQAWNWAVQDGIAEDTNRCITRVRGYVRGYRQILPYAYRAFN